MRISSFLPNFSMFSMFVEKPITMLSVVPAALAVPVIDLYEAATVLAILFVADFITGLLASYYEWKKKPIKKDNFFFGKGEGFSSDKFKKMFVKGMVYLGFPLFFIKFQSVFKIKSFGIKTVSEAQLDLVTIIIIIFCGNELFSIVRENLPRMGIDLIARLKNFLKEFNSIKNNNHE